MMIYRSDFPAKKPATRISKWFALMRVPVSVKLLLMVSGFNRSPGANETVKFHKIVI